MKRPWALEERRPAPARGETRLLTLTASWEVMLIVMMATLITVWEMGACMGCGQCGQQWGQQQQQQQKTKEEPSTARGGQAPEAER